MNLVNAGLGRVVKSRVNFARRTNHRGLGVRSARSGDPQVLNCGRQISLELKRDRFARVCRVGARGSACQVIDEFVSPRDEVRIDRQRASFVIDRPGHDGYAPAAEGPIDDPGIARIKSRRHPGIPGGLNDAVFKKVGADEGWTVPLPQCRQGRSKECARRRMSDRLAASGIAFHFAYAGRQPAPLR
jgi:hypothetical protein